MKLDDVPREYVDTSKQRLHSVDGNVDALSDDYSAAQVAPFRDTIPDNVRFWLQCL